MSAVTFPPLPRTVDRYVTAVNRSLWGRRSSWGGAAAGSADDDLGGQDLRPRDQARAGDPGHEAVRRAAAELVDRLADRRQRRVDDPAGVQVVEPGHRYIRR